MTTADLLVTTVYSGLFAVRQLLRLPFSSHLCAVMLLSVQIPSVASSLSLLLLNVDKLVCLQSPLRHAVAANRPIWLTALTVVWLISFIWSANFVLPHLADVNSTCQYKPPPVLLAAGLVAFFLLPILLSSAFSCRVVGIVFSARRHRARSSGRPTGRPILFVFATTLWAAVTTVPYRLFYLLIATGQIDPNAARRPTWFLYALLAVHPALNPIITIVTQRRYVAALRRFAIVMLRRHRRARLSRDFSSWPARGSDVGERRRRDTFALCDGLARPTGLKSSFSPQLPLRDPPASATQI